MKSSLVLSLLALETCSAAAQKVLSLDLQKHRKSAPLRKRATVLEPLGNAEFLYYANVTVGTPGQMLSLQIDTGSSDVWMTATGDSFCQQDQYNCAGGTFTPSQSSTYNVVAQGGFNISYVDGTGSSGDFFTDQLSIGGVTLNSLQMGIATTTTIGTGIIGVGFAADESVCTSAGPCQTYPTVVEQLVSQNKINSKAYSLWLNDLYASTGSLLFGGVDTDKYMGSLVTLPIQPDSQSNSITSFTVAFTDFTIGTSQGERTGFVPSGFVSPAILDSGTTLTLLPDTVANKVFAQAGATYDKQEGIWIAPCSLASINATFDFRFGGPSGPVIKVPLSEMIIPQPDNQGKPLQYANGKAACQFGIEPAGQNPVLFGDTFLRSAYVVYDLDNQQVSIAQTDFNATTSNVQEIKAGAGGVPNVASTANGASASQTVTGIPKGGKQSASDLVGTATGAGSYATDPPLASLATVTGSPAVTVTSGSTSLTSNVAAAGLKTFKSDFSGIVVIGVSLVFAMLGGFLVLW